MRITECGRILFAEDFWDCECSEKFIHRKSTEPHCGVCGYDNEEMPDSRLSEILIYSPHMLTEDERREAIENYVNMAGFLG